MIPLLWSVFMIKPFWMVYEIKCALNENTWNIFGGASCALNTTRRKQERQHCDIRWRQRAPVGVIFSQTANHVWLRYDSAAVFLWPTFVLEGWQDFKKNWGCTVVWWLASQQKGFWFESRLGPFCVEFACSPRECVGSLQVLQLPPSVQKHAC